MSADLLFRVALGLAAVVAAAWPFVKPRVEALLSRAGRKPAAPPAPAVPDAAADAHVVMSIAIRLKEAGKVKSAEIARSLVDSMLTE